MTAQLHQTPDAQKEAARAAIKAREDGIRANAIKQGRVLERADLLQALGKQTLEEASQTAQLRAERDARPTMEQYGRHGMARLYQGVAIGAAFGAALTVAVGSTLLLAGTQSAVQGAAAGSMIRAQSENVRILDAAERNEYRRAPREPADGSNSN